jgi:hypothetical protein
MKLMEVNPDVLHFAFAETKGKKEDFAVHSPDELEING